MPRFYCPTPLNTGQQLDLPAGAARHIQVLRMQPGDTVTLFSGDGGEFEATIERMGRSDVGVTIGAYSPVEREARRTVHLAIGMPANERMDWLVEKATELGVASIQPLMTERTVLRLSGERAEKKVVHWQSVAIAACEQCGGNRVPVIHDIMGFATWIKAQSSNETGLTLLLSLQPGTADLHDATSASSQANGPITFLAGPEGGLSLTEEETALTCRYTPVTLGVRVLRAETAALAALAALLVQ